MERLYPRHSAERRFPEERDPTCVASEGSSRNDRLVLVHIGPISNIVLEGALGLVVGQGGRVVLRVKAVVGGDTLQALEGGLAAPGLCQAVAAIVALYALEGVLASKFTWREGRACEMCLASTGMLLACHGQEKDVLRTPCYTGRRQPGKCCCPTTPHLQTKYSLKLGYLYYLCNSEQGYLSPGEVQAAKQGRVRGKTQSLDSQPKTDAWGKLESVLCFKKATAEK